MNNAIESAATMINDRLNQIASLSIRIQAAESVGLYAVAEVWRERMEKLKADLAEVAPQIEAAAARKKGRVN